jgi:hypothetical protein
MEITLGCRTASVTVLDTNYAEVVSFYNIPVMGDTGMCFDANVGLKPIFGNKGDRID